MTCNKKIIQQLVHIATSVVFTTEAVQVMTEYVRLTGNKTLPDKAVFKQAMQEADARRVKRHKNIERHQQFGLTVQKPTGFRDELGYATWYCNCICGNTTIKSTHQLNMGAQTCSNKTFRCSAAGKYRKRKDNSHKSTVEYKRWWGMLDRCTNPHAANYAAYGAQGITVCERWGNFESFLFDMGPAPTYVYKEVNGRAVKMSGRALLKRVDTKKEYSKSNCHWLFSAHTDHVVYEPPQETRTQTKQTTPRQVPTDELIDEYMNKTVKH